MFSKEHIHQKIGIRNHVFQGTHTSKTEILLISGVNCRINNVIFS